MRHTAESTEKKTRDPGRSSPSGSRGRTVGLWLVQIVLGAMFFMAGTAKLMGQSEMVAMFDAIGIGQWFRYLTGSIEVTGALLLLIPGLAGLGAVLLMALMTGAILTHLFVIGGSILVPLGLLCGVAAIAFGRRGQVRALMRRFTGP